MDLVAATRITKNSNLIMRIVAYGFGLLLLNGCQDPLDLVKQELAEPNQQSLMVALNPNSAPKAVPTRVAASSTVITDTPEFGSNSSETDPVDQVFTYQASALPSPFRIANFIDSSTPATPLEEDRFKQQSNWPDKKSDPLLSKFQYRGRIAGVNGATYGLIQRPDGIIMKVKVGQSVGQEPIRVIEITPTQINLVEQGVSPEAEGTAKRLALIAPVAR